VRRFVPALQRISSELELPDSLRARILLEMAGDLEALYEHYRGRGFEDDEAARLTEERLLASPEALQNLILVHTTVYQRWLSRAAERARWGFDLLLFVLGVVPMLALSVGLLAGRVGGMLSEPGVWPMLLVGACVIGLAGWKAYQLFLAGDHATAALHRGMPTLLFLAVAGPAVGGAAFLIHLYGLSMAIMGRQASADALYGAAETLEQGATHLSMGLLVGIGAGLVWFVLARRVSALEQARSAALLAG
jgi:hypothetical protein